jgi:hypothetical protein
MNLYSLKYEAGLGRGQVGRTSLCFPRFEFCQIVPLLILALLTLGALLVFSNQKGEILEFGFNYDLSSTLH